MKARTLEVREFRLSKAWSTQYRSVFEFKGLVESESREHQDFYEVIVRVKVSNVTRTPTLASYYCECLYYLRKGGICKHIKRLYNKALEHLKEMRVI